MFFCFRTASLGGSELIAGAKNDTAYCFAPEKRHLA